MNRKRLTKKLNEHGMFKIKVKTIRRLLKYRIEKQDLDSILNDMMDRDDFYSDMWDKNEKNL